MSSGLPMLHMDCFSRCTRQLFRIVGMTSSASTARSWNASSPYAISRWRTAFRNHTAPNRLLVYNLGHGPTMTSTTRLVLGLTVSALALFGQAFTGTITGTVTDPNG